MDADRFEHEPLDLTQTGNVRLIRLQPTQHDQSIRCSRLCNLSVQNTVYSAASYKWGEPTAVQDETSSVASFQALTQDDWNVVELAMYNTSFSSWNESTFVG